MEIYKTIAELPIWNFWEVVEKNELRYLLKLKDYEQLPECTEEQLHELYELWSELDYQYFEYFGIEDKYLNRLKLEKSIIMLEIDVALGKNTLSIVRLRQQKRVLAELNESSEEGLKPLDMLINVEKFMGFHLKPEQISVKKFYSYVKNMVKK